MSQAVVVERSPIRKMQGIEVPAESVNPELFFERTTRHVYTELKPRGWAGFGSDEQPMTIRRADVLAHLRLRFVGTLTVTPGTGTVATTGRWPHDLPKKIAFNANGQSNLISCSGGKLKVRDQIANRELTDRGVVNTVGGIARQQGTLALASESWGVGSLTTGIAGGSYPVDLTWEIPIADDEVDLAGAIYCPTTSTDLELMVSWANLTQMFALTGNAAVALTGTVELEGIKYAIPEDANGQIIIPDLSLFHMLVQSGGGGDAPVLGGNEAKLTGQGPGKSLLRIIGQVWNNTGTGTEAPLAVNDTNYAAISWRYATSEEPDVFRTGAVLRQHLERLFNTDIGGLFGFWVHDFASQNALRDIVDMGTHSEIRAAYELASGLTLVAPRAELVQELMFRAGD
jgi:hypothetical protein